MSFNALKPHIISIVEDMTLTVDERLTRICNLLRTQVDSYNWVGFYFRNGTKKELKLRAFSGIPTAHTIIPFGSGICGQVAVSNQNFIVPDVAAQDNYIACSIDVKSEIVIPLFVKGKNIGQIDIDSYAHDPFTAADETFLEFVNQKVAEIL